MISSHAALRKASRFSIVTVWLNSAAITAGTARFVYGDTNVTVETMIKNAIPATAVRLLSLSGLLFPVQPLLHQWMFRILLAPVALGFAALLWQWQVRPQEGPHAPPWRLTARRRPDPS